MSVQHGRRRTERMRNDEEIQAALRVAKADRLAAHDYDLLGPFDVVGCETLELFNARAIFGSSSIMRIFFMAICCMARLNRGEWPARTI